METYTKEVNYISRQIVGEVWENVIIAKTATFAELSRIDPRQNKLQWKIMEMMESANVDDDTQKAHLNSGALCDLVYKYVREMLVIDDVAVFSEQDKTEFMKDNGAIMQFGLWALQEKISPFFSMLMSK
jgi:hypothetical protein